eukprot:8490143-Pyramimonas_sp.AAC.1
MFLQWDLTATVLTEPGRLYEAGISDHAPVSITFRGRRQRPSDQQAVPAFPCKSREFQEMLQLLISQSELERPSPIPKWRELKRLMREAARLARDKLTRSATPPLEARLVMSRSVSRAARLDDVKPASILLARAPIARDRMALDEAPST